MKTGCPVVKIWALATSTPLEAVVWEACQMEASKRILVYPCPLASYLGLIIKAWAHRGLPKTCILTRAFAVMRQNKSVFGAMKVAEASNQSEGSYTKDQ